MSECESLLAECRDNLAVAVRRATEAEARIAALEAERDTLADAIHPTRHTGLGLSWTVANLASLAEAQHEDSLFVDGVPDEPSERQAALALRRGQAEARIAVLEAGLRDLTAEVRGNWEIDEAGLRSVLGHTNYTCVQRRVNEARALLRAPKEER